MINTGWSLTFSFTDGNDEEEEKKEDEEEEEEEGEEEERKDEEEEDEKKEEEKKREKGEEEEEEEKGEETEEKKEGKKIKEEKEEEKAGEEEEEKEEEKQQQQQQQRGEEGNKDRGFFNASDFVDKGDDGVRETVEKNVDMKLGFLSAVDKYEHEGLEKEEEDPREFERKSKQLKEVFSCLPLVLIKIVLRRDDVKGNPERARQKLQEFQDIKNPADVFNNPAERRPLITKPKGKFEDPLTHGSIKQAWVAGDKSYGGPEHESNRGMKNRSKPREKNQTQGKHGDAERQDTRRNGCDSDKSDQNKRNQACRRHNSRQRDNTRAGPERGPRGGFYQDPNNTQVYRDDQFYNTQGQWFDHKNAFLSQRGRENQRGQRGCFRQDPITGNRGYSRYGSQEWHVGDEGNSQPQMGRGGQGGRGTPPKPKPKPKRKGRGQGGGRGGNFQEQHQIPGDFQESNQFSDAEDYSQFMQRQPNQKNGRGRDSHGNQLHPISLKELVSIKTPSSSDDSEPGKLRQGETNKGRQGDRGRPQNGLGNRDAGQTGIRRAQSMPSVAEEEPADQSLFERNKILIQGLGGKTSRERLVNFIKAKSGGEEVKDVQMLKNGKALVTMADEIKGTYLSTEFGDLAGISLFYVYDLFVSYQG